MKEWFKKNFKMVNIMLNYLKNNILLTFDQKLSKEMMQSGQYNKSYSGNSNRDRYQKYNHPRGAPDADAIFRSSSHQQNKYILS